MTNNRASGSDRQRPAERQSGREILQRPFYFYVVCWGEQYRNYLIELCLPSLLAPNNIPALDSRNKSFFLICTTREDWEVIQTAPIFRLLESTIKPVWIEMPNPGPDESKMLLMSRGHKAAAGMAFRDRAIGVLLAPDLVLSDGTIAEIQRLALDGKRLVLAAALRFSMDPIVEIFKARRLMVRDEPLTLPPRELMDIALKNLHSEFLRYDWDAPYYADFPIASYWSVPDGSGIVVRSFSWAPILIDYGSMKEHRDQTLGSWTIDGDYVNQNFPGVRPSDRDVHVVTDSDNLALVSLSREAEYSYHPLVGHWMKSIPVAGEWTKGHLLHRAYNNYVFDDLKRQLFLVPIRMHGGKISEAWNRIEAKSMAIICRHVRSKVLDKYLDKSSGNTKHKWKRTGILSNLKLVPLLVIQRIWQFGFLEPRRTWLFFIPYVRVIALAGMGNRTEMARIKRRIVIIWLNLAARRGK